MRYATKFLLYFYREVWISARDVNVDTWPTTYTPLRRQYKTIDGSQYIPFSAWKPSDQPKVSSDLTKNCVVYKDLQWEVKGCAETKYVVCFAKIGKQFCYRSFGCVCHVALITSPPHRGRARYCNAHVCLLLFEIFDFRKVYWSPRSVCLSVCLFVCLSVCLFVCLFVRLQRLYRPHRLSDHPDFFCRRCHLDTRQCRTFSFENRIKGKVKVTTFVKNR